MGTSRILSGAVAALLSCVSAAQAQNSSVVLPTIDVGFSRTGSAGIVGASTTVITAQDIERSPSQSLPDILATQVGIQVLHQGSPLGVNDAVDLRGFGAFAQSNTLILVNGRRYQDFDLQGFDFATIPLNSIERIEVTRGNSGTVLYGDGAVGGVINIVTKNIAQPGVSGKVEGAAGSYGFGEGRFSGAANSGPWSAGVYSNVATSRGYRQNSELRQENVVSNLNYRSPAFSYYLNVAADRQRQNLPGNLYNFASFYPTTLSTPRASVFPFDWAHKQDFNLTTGVTMPVWSGAELIVDGGIRRKFPQAQFFNYFPAPAFTFDPNSQAPASYLNTGMTTLSLTPRLDVSHRVFGVPGQLLTGFDLYDTTYESDRYASPGAQSFHHYSIRQTTTAFYAMNKAAVTPDVELSAGGRIQRIKIGAIDAYNADPDPNAGNYAPGVSPQAPQFDSSEWQWAAHAGAEYRVTQMWTVFARVARAFRVPNADERVAAGNPFGTDFPANFALKTQTSHDVEGGVRFKWQRLDVQSSVYRMDLTNEIHFLPVPFVDVNLDPTRREGWETTANYRLTDDVRLRAAGAYTHALYREGPFTGKDIPLVSRWSGSTGVSWDIVKKLAVLDVTARMWSSRVMDNDQSNVQPKIPANATVDVRIAGEYERFFWSASVQNLFNVSYFDYSIASASTRGQYAAFPLPGRTFVLRTGATF